MGSAVFLSPQLARLALFTFVLCGSAQADVRFTSPGAGQNVAVGRMEVQWEDSGVEPSIPDLTGYTLTLMVGGNNDDDMLALTTFASQRSFAAGDKATGTIPSDVASGLDDGFFFRMVSTTKSGGDVTNYSPRFNLTGLTGTTPSKYRRAAEDLNGSTDGPAAINPYANISALVSATPEAASPSSTPAAQPDTPSASSSLSSVAKVLIAAGSLLGGMALCASSVGVVFLHHRRRQQKLARKLRDQYSFKTELEVVPDPPAPQQPVIVSEMSHEQGAIVEADHGLPRPELDHMSIRAELEARRSGFAR